MELAKTDLLMDLRRLDCDRTLLSQELGSLLPGTTPHAQPASSSRVGEGTSIVNLEDKGVLERSLHARRSLALEAILHGAAANGGGKEGAEG